MFLCTLSHKRIDLQNIMKTFVYGKIVTFLQFTYEWAKICG